MSPIPSDQRSPSFVAPKVSIVSDTLPVIPSIQLINSCAPEDETYKLHWNPVWEPSEEDIPPTPPGVLVPMSSSDMEDTSPVTSEESVATSGEIPTSTETTPFRITSLGVTLPLGYKALRDVMSSRTPPTSSMWSHTITPTSESFIPQIHNVPVTFVPTIPIVCVASSTPVLGVVTTSSVVTTTTRPSSGSAYSGPSTSVSGVVDPTLGAPPSSSSIPAGGAYDEYLHALQNADPQNHFHYYDSRGAHIYYRGPLPPQLAVEVTIPLSVAWNPTRYGGGQVSPAHLQGPPNQGQPSYV